MAEKSTDWWHHPNLWNKVWSFHILFNPFSSWLYKNYVQLFKRSQSFVHIIRLVSICKYLKAYSVHTVKTLFSHNLANEFSIVANVLSRMHVSFPNSFKAPWTLINFFKVLNSFTLPQCWKDKLWSYPLKCGSLVKHSHTADLDL